MVVPRSSRKRSGIAPLACGLAAALGLVTLSRPAQAIPRPPRASSSSSVIRVLLGNHARAVVQGYDITVNGADLPGTSVFSLRCGSDGAARYVEYGGGQRTSGRLEIGARAGFLRFNGRSYRGHLLVLPQERSCEVVNTVDVEKYVAGVIAREMAPSWPLEALKAQAVAARSYVLFQAEANRGRDYDVENGTQDQVYEGADAEAPRTMQATEATRGQALAYDAHTLKAYFHANCGGITEVPELVWGGDPKAFRPVVCPYHQRARDRAHWSAVVSRAQLEGALRRVAGLLPSSFRRVASLEAGAPDRSHRLSDVAVSDDGGTNVLVSANAFRNALGNTRLKSTSFQIHRDPAGYRIEGEGNGHGVGLCQVGAREMAEQGKSYREILRFYYPLAKIRALQ